MQANINDNTKYTLRNLKQIYKLTDVFHILETSTILNQTLSLVKKVLVLSTVLTTPAAMVLTNTAWYS